MRQTAQAVEYRSSITLTDTVRDVLLAFVRVHVLHHAVSERVYGAGMAEELARHGYQLSPGTLYPPLHRLELDGLLVSESEVVAGKVRKYYVATDFGVPRVPRRSQCPRAAGPDKATWPYPTPPGDRARPHRVVQRRAQHADDGRVDATHGALHAIALPQRFPERQGARDEQECGDEVAGAGRGACGSGWMAFGRLNSTAPLRWTFPPRPAPV